jgi:GGDEF domain-containing protein
MDNGSSLLEADIAERMARLVEDNPDVYSLVDIGVQRGRWTEVNGRPGTFIPFPFALEEQVKIILEELGPELFKSEYDNQRLADIKANEMAAGNHYSDDEIKIKAGKVRALFEEAAKQLVMIDPQTGLLNAKYHVINEELIQLYLHHQVAAGVPLLEHGEACYITRVAFDFSNLRGLNVLLSGMDASADRLQSTAEGEKLADDLMAIVCRIIQDEVGAYPELSGEPYIQRSSGDEFEWIAFNIPPHEVDNIRSNINYRVNQLIADLGLGNILNPKNYKGESVYRQGTGIESAAEYILRGEDSIAVGAMLDKGIDEAKAYRQNFWSDVFNHLIFDEYTQQPIQRDLVRIKNNLEAAFPGTTQVFPEIWQHYEDAEVAVYYDDNKQPHVREVQFGPARLEATRQAIQEVVKLMGIPPHDERQQKAGLFDRSTVTEILREHGDPGLSAAWNKFLSRDSSGSFDHWASLTRRMCMRALADVYDLGGKSATLLGVIQDVMEKRSSITGLHRDSINDILTNAVEFLESNPDKQKILLVLELQNFAGINSAYGHAFTDETMSYVAALVEDHFQKGFAEFGAEDMPITVAYHPKGNGPRIVLETTWDGSQEEYAAIVSPQITAIQNELQIYAQHYGIETLENPRYPGQRHSGLNLVAHAQPLFAVENLDTDGHVEWFASKIEEFISYLKKEALVMYMEGQSPMHMANALPKQRAVGNPDGKLARIENNRGKPHEMTFM